MENDQAMTHGESLAMAGTSNSLGVAPYGAGMKEAPPWAATV